MKSVSADGTTIYVPVHRWSKYDKVPCLGAQWFPAAYLCYETTKCGTRSQIDVLWDHWVWHLGLRPLLCDHWVWHQVSNRPGVETTPLMWLNSPGDGGAWSCERVVWYVTQGSYLIHFCYWPAASNNYDSPLFMIENDLVHISCVTLHTVTFTKAEHFWMQ